MFLMLELQWESQRPFLFAIICQFRILTSFIRESFLLLYHILFYLLLLLRLQSLSLSLLCQLPQYLVSGFYDVITLYGETRRILKYSFSITLPGSCLYQSFAPLNPSFSQNCQYTYLPILLGFRLYFFEQVCHIYSQYDIQSHFLYHTSYKGVTCQFFPCCT